MSSFITLHSADSTVKRVMVEQDHIESIFEYDGNNKNKKTEELIVEIENDILVWGSKAVAFLSRSRSKEAQELVEEFDNIYDIFINSVNKSTTEKEYTVVKCFSGNYYTVKESLDDVNQLIEENNYHDKLGFSI